MYHRLIVGIAIISLLVFCKNLSANNLSLNETPSKIFVQKDNYGIEIDKIGFSFELTYNKRMVFQTYAKNPFCMVENGKENYIGKLLKMKRIKDTLYLTYACSTSNEKINLKICFYQDHFNLILNTGRDYDKLGCNIQLNKEDNWYGGNITSAQHWPANSASFEVDPFYSDSNQTSPIWISTKGVGVFVNTNNTMGYSFNKDGSSLFSFHVKNTNAVHLSVTIGKTITDTYLSMIDIVGKPQVIPPYEYFAQPIFNSWIEFKKDVNQSGLIRYAKEIRNHNIPCTILEIDDMWTCAYGEFDFDSVKFPNPKEMIQQLTANKFKVALWVTPFVEEKAKTYNYLRDKGYLVLNGDKTMPYITTWWNGNAALIDLSNPQAYDWFLMQLKNLQQKYGISGVKLDAGDADFLDKPHHTFGSISANQYTDLFASVGQYFEINELRVSWLTQPLGLVQRLRDKSSDWSQNNGIGAIIPHGITEGLIGYPFFCPDMIGGGEIGSFDKINDKIDQELFIRWAQVSTFMPMMQYSFAPWRLDSLSANLCKKYSDIHEKLGDYIYSLATLSKTTGAPIVRPLFYQFPNDSLTFSISDQFMLGSRFLVAPILIKGDTSRNIYLPKGTWIDYWNGDLIQGGQTLMNYASPIEKLPVFINLL